MARMNSLKVCDRYAYFKLTYCVEDLKCLAHVYKVIGIVQVQKRFAKVGSLKSLSSRNLNEGDRHETRTLNSFRCHAGYHSCPAASITSSTAAARSSLMLRIFSSALGERSLKFSQASNRIAEGDVEPGRKTDTLDAEYGY